MTKSEKAINTLTMRINSGTWRVGEKLPVEDELCRQIGVGRNTLREAVAALEQQGILRRMQGAGTFLCQDFSTLLRETEKETETLLARFADEIKEILKETP